MNLSVERLAPAHDDLSVNQPVVDAIELERHFGTPPMATIDALRPLRRVTRGDDRRHRVGEDEIEQRRQVHARDEHRVVHAVENPARRHRAAARLQVGEDHAARRWRPSPSRNKASMSSTPSCFTASGSSMRAAAGDLLDGGDQARREVAVPSDDRARAVDRAAFSLLIVFLQIPLDVGPVAHLFDEAIVESLARGRCRCT